MAITTEAQTRRAADPRRAVVVNLLVNLVAPLGIFYGLNAFGVDQWLALMLGAIPPTVHAVYTVIVRRRLDALALFTMTILLGSVATSFVVGSPRLLLAKDGWMTAVAGLWILITLRGKPFLHQFVQSVATGDMRARLEINWRDSPTFRHVMRMATAMWGVGLVLDAGVRIVLAYSLPVAQVPLINTVQYFVMYAGLEIATRLYLRRKSVQEQVFAESGQVMIGGRKR